MREELDDLKREREREDARNRSAVAEAEEHRKENVRQRRLEGGSRFNIRYQDQLPGSALTTEAVMSGSPMLPKLGLGSPAKACCSRRPMRYSVPR